MKYITQVKDGSDIKHIVEVNGKNVEVIQSGEKERYGNRAGENYFIANYIKVAKDFSFISASGNSDFVDLARVVLAIELVRFVINHLKG